MRSEVTETQTHLTHQPSGRGEEEKATIRLISQSAKTQSKINLHWLSHSVSKERLHICHHHKDTALQFVVLRQKRELKMAFERC